MGNNSHPHDDDSGPFDIPHRPERITHEYTPVRNDQGELVYDDSGEVRMAGGGSTIEGYTRFDLTCSAYVRDEANEVLQTAESWGPYTLSWWEDYNPLVFDSDECCAFEVRVLPERVAIDVKRNTTSASVRDFVDRFTDRVEGDWDIRRDSGRLAP